MSLSRSATMVSWAAPARVSAALLQPASQRADSLASAGRLRSLPAGASGRVQIAASTRPTTASLSTSTAITGWMKKPVVVLFAAGPNPRRFLSRSVKLISVVSCTTRMRRPTQRSAVRAASVSTIRSTET